jgi:lysophospholipase L1-like esterase
VKPSRILLFAAIMLVQFGLFEAGLRIQAGSEAAPVFQQLFTLDPEIGVRLRPGASAHFKTSEFETDIVINSSGVRDGTIGRKPPGERRIVVLGDSMVLSVQVQADETFCARLQQRLNANRTPGGASYRVINAGVQGYGPVEEFRFFEHVASRFQADVVLVAVYVGNDAMEASDSGDAVLPRRASDRTAAAPAPAIAAGPSRWPVWMRRIVRHSMVLQIARLRALTLLRRYRQVRPIERALTMYLRTVPPDMERGLAVTRECVRRIARSAARRGARTGIVLVPARFQVADDDYQNVQATVAESGEALLRDAATDRFTAALSGLGLPMVDTLPALRAASGRTRIFMRTTAHLTRDGHEVMADALARFLRDSGLLDGSGG